MKTKFPSIPVEGYGSKLSQQDHQGLPINWHDSIKKKTIRSHENSIILIEDAHDIVTKSNVRTLRGVFNGAGRKMGCLTIDLLQSRDFAGYRLPPVPFQVMFEEPYHFWIKFAKNEEGPFDVSNNKFDAAVDAIIACLFDEKRPGERAKALPGRHTVSSSFLQRCFEEFATGKRPADVAKEMGFSPGSKQYKILTGVYWSRWQGR